LRSISFAFPITSYCFQEEEEEQERAVVAAALVVVLVVVVVIVMTPLKTPLPVVVLL
jgi:hypothetical protein